MSEFPKELSELRKEVVEARNQSIKTDNQIKNLALDIKGFEQRFDLLDKKAKYSSVGVYLIIAATVAVAGYLISSVSIQTAKEASAKALEDATRLQQELSTKETLLKTDRAALKKSIDDRDAIARDAVAFVEALEKRDVEAAEATVLNVDFKQLSTLEVALLEGQVTEFRDDRANEHYRVARDLLARSRKTDAIKSFERALTMSKTFRSADSARYLLGTTLREKGEYDRAIAVFREIEQYEENADVLEEVKFWLAYSLVRAAQREEGIAMLTTISEAGGRYSTSARRELGQLEGTEGSATSN